MPGRTVDYFNYADKTEQIDEYFHLLFFHDMKRNGSLVGPVLTMPTGDICVVI